MMRPSARVVRFVVLGMLVGAIRGADAGPTDLPPAAEAQVSARLGRDQTRYHAVPRDGGFRLQNARHGLVADFGRTGVAIRAGGAALDLALLGYGYTDAPGAAAPVAPRATANRVEYRRGALTEWYLNGPLGLEQGFTIERAPGRSAGTPLTLALALSGNLTATVGADGKDAILRRADTPALRYRGLTAFDATGRELPSWLEADGARLRLRVDDSGARYPVVVDPFIEEARLFASDGAASDQSGFSVAVSGDTVVVGAPGDNGVLGFDQGAAYVFVMPASGWANATETAKLTASSGGFSFFGSSVAISGDTVAVGAPFADFRNPAGILIPDQGAAYVFMKPAGGWANATTPTARPSTTSATRSPSPGTRSLPARTSTTSESAPTRARPMSLPGPPPAG